MTLLIGASYKNYKEHAVSFVVDTSHIRWDTDFPAITVCEKDSDKIYDIAEKLYGASRDMNIDLFLKDVAFYDGSCHSCAAHCDNGGALDCPTDLSGIVRMVRSSCPELIGSCSWRGDHVECCQHFRPTRTELGPCFVFNSALSDSTETHFRNGAKESRKRTFFSNRRSGPGVLIFQIKESIKLFLHSPYDVPYTNQPISERASVELGEGLILEFQTKEVENARGVEDVAVSQRRCRFPWEKPEGSTPRLYREYSYSTCVVECHAAAQLDACNCTDHFLPTPSSGWNRTCDIEGLACLTKFQSTLRSLKTDWSKKAGLVCECDTGCLEPEYTIVQKAKIQKSQSEKIPMVTVKMNALPSERFRRSVVRTRLDLVVSLGGTAGLFLGASVLSAAEIIYHAGAIIIRVWRKKQVHPATNPAPPGKEKTRVSQPSSYMGMSLNKF